MEHPIKMDDLGGKPTIIGNIPICENFNQFHVRHNGCNPPTYSWLLSLQSKYYPWRLRCSLGHFGSPQPDSMNQRSMVIHVAVDSPTTATLATWTPLFRFWLHQSMLAELSWSSAWRTGSSLYLTIRVGICDFCATDATRRRSSWDTSIGIKAAMLPPILVFDGRLNPRFGTCPKPQLARNVMKCQPRESFCDLQSAPKSWRFNLGILTVAEYGSQLYSQALYYIYIYLFFSQPDVVFSN